MNLERFQALHRALGRWSREQLEEIAERVKPRSGDGLPHPPGSGCGQCSEMRAIGQVGPDLYFKVVAGNLTWKQAVEEARQIDELVEKGDITTAEAIARAKNA